MREMRTILAVIMLGLSAGALEAPAQPGLTSQPSFEVATIKPTASGEEGAGTWSPPGIGRFWAKSLPLGYLIQIAFNVDPDQIAGKPGWIDSAYFDVTAKAETGIKLSREELRPRLRHLLQERFHLATHFETKMKPGYALVVSKGGPILRPTAGDRFPGFRINVSPGSMQGANWSMTYLAAMLQRPAGRPVADETGVTGSYDIDFKYAPDMETDSTLPSLFTALKESLGLELKAKSIPVQVLVIDHVDRVPTAN